MNFFDWLKPGLNLKRWIFLGIIGIMFQSYGIAVFISMNLAYDISTFSAIVSIIIGLALMAISLIFLGKTFLSVINHGGITGSIDSKRLRALFIEKKHQANGPIIVAIGGGTGLSTMLRGLKEYTSNLTAVVTVSDDGGGSGVLREDLGILPPGDIRNCILALATTEPILEKLLQYRFTEGMLKNQSFGNLFLAAMDGISGGFDKAVRKMSDVLAVTGTVLPVSIDDIKLRAVMQDGSSIYGETNIVDKAKEKEKNNKIKNIFIEPQEASALPEVLECIKNADVILIGPGSLYTSILPNLLVNGVCETINESNALKIYIANIMTQPGETDNLTASEHIKALFDNSKLKTIDCCIANKGVIKSALKQKYNQDGAKKVIVDENKIKSKGIKLYKEDIIATETGFIRHDNKKLASIILKVINEEIILKDKRKIIDYFFNKKRIKKNNTAC